MEGSRIEQAIARIETALGRVEAASNRLAQNSGGDAALRQRHEAMRAEVSTTLHELDQLIRKIEQ